MGYSIYAEPDDALLAKFDVLLQDHPRDERRFQTFFEDHPEFLHTPFLLNHGLHCDALLSQFRLRTDLTTDFAYLTKSSNVWWLVLVEIEPPSLPLFTRATAVQPTAEMTKRLAQIDDWELAFKESKSSVLESLGPLLRPLTDNQVDLRRVLICGRSEEPLADHRARNRLNSLGGPDVSILTYDSLRRSYLRGRNELKNVLSIRKGRFHFKRLHIEPPLMFAYMSPHELRLSKADKAKLKAWDYQIDAWETGQLLKVNEKYPDLAVNKARNLL
jgi:hypothetical protein